MSAAAAEKIEGVNRTRLSRELGVTRSYLSTVLSGGKRPSLELALGLGKALRVSVEELSEYLEGKKAN